MPLLSTQQIPPGGFSYRQPETGYAAQHAFSGFMDAVREISAHRAANKLARSSLAEVAKDIDDSVCARLGNDSRFCQQTQKKTQQITSRPLAGAAAGAVRVAVAKDNPPTTNTDGKISEDYLNKFQVKLPDNV